MQEKLCFVIGPIGEPKTDVRMHADILLNKIIRPTFSRYFKEFIIIRADKIARPGMIHDQVITALIEADLVVADLTGRNANAFYELGIRHFVQRPIIHLYRHGDQVPFDVAPYRAIGFAYDDKEDVREAKIGLRNMVTESLHPKFMIDNPVTRSTGFLRMQEATAPRLEKMKFPSHARQADEFRPGNKPYIPNAPGLTWTIVKDGWLAVWKAPTDAIRKGWRPGKVKLWVGNMDALNELTRRFISERANDLQLELRTWQRGTGVYAR